jgi:4-amino-4-deoxy-L-arabinose transferase-like glycosyltransferase
MKAILDRTGKEVTLALLVIGGLLFLYYVGARDLWPTDEDEYAQISREMLRSGNWLIATCNGQPWTIKPILLNWLIDTISLPWGDVDEFRARFFSSISALATFMLTYMLGKRMFSTRAGILSALVLGTSLLFIQQSRWAQTYMLSTFFSTAAIACFYLAYTSPARRTLMYLLMYTSTALGVLTMGPVNLAMPGLVCLVFILWMRDLPHLKEMKLVPGILLFLAIVAPWYVMMATQDDYGFDLLIKTNFSRYVNTWTHSQPFYFYARDLIYTFAPWSFFLPGALVLAFTRRLQEHRQATTFILVWFFSLLIFFSIADGKRPQYLLAAYPALALLIGYLFDRALHNWPETFYRKAVIIPSVILMVLWAVIAIAAPVAATVYDSEWLPATLGVSALTATFAVLTFLAWRKERPDQLVVLPAILVLLTVLYSVHVIIPRVEPLKSIKPYSEFVRSQLDREPNTAWGMYKSYRARYIYYVDKFTTELNEEDELLEFLAQPNPALVILRARSYDKLKLTHLADYEVLDRTEIGSRELILISNGYSDSITTPDQPAGQDQK